VGNACEIKTEVQNGDLIPEITSLFFMHLQGLKLSAVLG